MKCVMISIRPKWCEKIASGKKTIEVRKTAPKEVPFKAYIYCTKDRRNLLPIEHGKVLQKVNFWENTDAYYGFGKVIGEFICDEIITISYIESGYLRRTFKTDKPIKIKETGLTPSELDKYAFNNKGIFELPTLYGWHITALKIYDKPKGGGEFFKPCPTKEKGDCLSCDCLADNDYGGICTNNLTRPPQSWCYVEELCKAQN